MPHYTDTSNQKVQIKNKIKKRQCALQLKKYHLHVSKFTIITYIMWHLKHKTAIINILFYLNHKSTISENYTY
jgi:hypothetical protein